MEVWREEGLRTDQFQHSHHLVHVTIVPPSLFHFALLLPLPLPSQETRAFVLKLWQFLHIRALQRKHNIPDSSVEVLTPLPLGQLSGGEPRIIERIKVILIAVLQRGLNRSDFDRLRKETSLSVLVFTEKEKWEWGSRGDNFSIEKLI